MLEVYADTEKMRSCGNDILQLVEEFKMTVNTMFTRIENIPVHTKEWVGESAQEFATKAMNDKIQYLNFANDLYKYGKYLLDCADYFDKTAQKVRKS